MVGELCERLRLMFFGNLHQGWSEFVLADLGIFRYEAVALDVASRAFQNRADVDFYLSISASRQALDEGADAEQLLQSLLKQQNAHPGWISAGQGVAAHRPGLRRAQDWPLAAQAYTASHYPGARHRHIRVLERMQCFDQALALASQAQAAPESEEERQRVAACCRACAAAWSGRQCTPGRTGSSRGGRAAMCCWICPTRPAPWNMCCATIGIALQRPCSMWKMRSSIHSSDCCAGRQFSRHCPVHFSPVSGGPADLGAPDFVVRRQPLFDACMAELKDGRYRASIRALCRQGRHSVAFCLLGHADRRAAGAGPGLHSRTFRRCLRVCCWM